MTDYDYDPVGNLIKTVFPNGVIENQQYDFLNRLIYLENRQQTDVISSYTYTLDGMGNRLKVEENDGRIVEYSYDKLYRLTQEKITDSVAGNKTIQYQFDAVSNRLQKIDSVDGITTYTYDDNDRLLQEILGGKVTNYQYDNEGNLIAKIENGQTQTVYEWNAKGELTAVEVTENGQTGRIEFEYDHSGIRVAINVDGEETRFLLDNNQQQYAQVIEEYKVNGDVKTTYTHGWDLISQDNGNNRIYYQVDGLGSTRQLTDINGAVVVEYDYDAYGNLTRKVGDADNSYLFAGEQFDEAVDGYYLRARYYDSLTGRFVSTDPFEGYNNQPITLHDYLYAGVNPVNAIDPSGEVTAKEVLILLATTGIFIKRNFFTILDFAFAILEIFALYYNPLDPSSPPSPPDPPGIEEPATRNPSNSGPGNNPPSGSGNNSQPNNKPPNNPPRNPNSSGSSPVKMNSLTVRNRRYEAFSRIIRGLPRGR